MCANVARQRIPFNSLIGRPSMLPTRARGERKLMNHSFENKCWVKISVGYRKNPDYNLLHLGSNSTGFRHTRESGYPG